MTCPRRRALLTALALPAGCGIAPLRPLPTTALPAAGAAAVSLRAPAVGQAWTYTQFDFFNSRLVDVVEETVVSVVPTVRIRRQARSGAGLADEEHAAWGQLLRESVWDYPMTFESPLPLWPATPAPGASASARTHYRIDGGSIRFWIDVSSAAHGWERVSVEAGTFDTLRVERLLRLEHQDVLRTSTLRRDTLWLSAEVGRAVARETSGRYFVRGEGRFLPSASLEDHFRWQLTAWR
jgi:hypothetical protein